ncbi:MAG: helix-turn-helix domain-containing protein [Deltaproteobacteria bacterium]|nr:MAG: helix-turn-helix domain-containing protein [Deltaproteobacteria bacterium]
MTREETRRIRGTLGLTQAAFAERLGVTRVTVARWETGLVKVPRTAELLMRLLAQQARPKRRVGK